MTGVKLNNYGIPEQFLYYWVMDFRKKKQNQKEKEIKVYPNNKLIFIFIFQLPKNYLLT